MRQNAGSGIQQRNRSHRAAQPFLINHGRGDYADPCSLIRTAGMLMAHIGYGDRKAILDEALDICTITERKKIVTTDVDGASAAEFTDYLLETLDRLKK